jgi:hypothetical protein
VGAYTVSFSIKLHLLIYYKQLKIIIMTGKTKKVDFNYINRVMKKSDYKGENKLICITNGKEVLRITKKIAKEYFFKRVVADEETLKIKKSLAYEVNFEKGFYYQKTDGWYYTTKSIYKQYIESLKPNSKIPAPKFTMKKMNSKGIEETINTHIYIH